MDFWEYWGFEPWSHLGMKGLSRKVTFVKSGLMGEVARYYAYDYIVWTHRGKIDADEILASWKPLQDVMLQRFLFLEDRALEKKKIKSFLLGFRGFLEIYHYSINGEYDKKIKDLAPLVDRAWELLHDAEFRDRGVDAGVDK